MTRQQFRFINPWRVEGRQTAFHPWVVLSLQARLSCAIAESERQRDLGKFYATRVRAN